MLTGENGIINRTGEAKLTSKLAEIEEQANLILLNSKVDLYQGNTPATILEMVNELKSKGYNIYSERTGGDAISDITVSPTMKIEADSTATINVTLVPNPNSVADYYAVEGGKYYKMHYNADKVTIDKTESTVSGTGVGGSNDLTAEIKNGSTGTGISIGTISGNSIPLSSTEDASGVTTIVVTYGNISKECAVSIAIVPTYTQGNENTVIFPTKFGTIDVIWLNGTGTTTEDVTDTPNSPATHLAGMTPVKFSSDGTITPTTTSDTSWYSYNAGGTATANGLPDNNTSNWANAQNTDESLFVWIPRFAYRITYYDVDDATGITPTAIPTGYYDGYGMWDANTGKIRYKLEENIRTVEYNGDKYIIHPAFCNGVTDGYNEGQWSSALEGFWVAKYEMSKEVKSNNTWNTTYITSETDGNVQVGDTIRAVSKAGKSSWRYITIGNCYYNALHYAENDSNNTNDTTANSHLMKNSEWGAVAYLTHSQYGRNGTEITKNGSNTYTSGDCGIASSTTDNYYGIYDLSGSANEYVSAFNNKTSGSIYSNNGWIGLTENTLGNEYATKYYNNDFYDSGPKIYNIGKVGEASKEVYTNYKKRIGSNDFYYSWFNNWSLYVRDAGPFPVRGGIGIFDSGSSAGDGTERRSYRVVLVP